MDGRWRRLAQVFGVEDEEDGGVRLLKEHNELVDCELTESASVSVESYKIGDARESCLDGACASGDRSRVK
jgi:hypothetical protein